MKGRRLGVVVLGGFGGLGLILALWAFWLEPASLVTRPVDVDIPNWPSACDGLKVVVLADIHVGAPHVGLDKLERIVEATLDTAPDLILLAGDFVIHGVVGGRFVPPEESAEILGRLEAPAGVFAVLGNHDWWYDANRVLDAFEAVGIPTLEDRARPIESKQCQFWLSGLSDFWEGPHDLKAALDAVPDAAPTLLFTHNPDVFPEVPASVSLTLAGHTHGGQVYIPGIGRPIVPSRYGERYAIGHIVEKGRHLFVSPGIGTSILPVRFLVPPEVTVLQLRSMNSSGASGGSRAAVLR